MNSLLAFSPILALVAFLSVEVSAESFTSFQAISDAGHTDGFEYSWRVNVEPPFLVATNGTLDGCTSAELGTCSETPATFDNGDTVDIFGTLPEVGNQAGQLSVPADSTPTVIEFKMCFAVASTVDRKWRKFNDLFKKDNSCTNGAVAKLDYVPGPFETSMTLKSVTPTALFTVRAYITCEGAGNSEYCHVVNIKTADTQEAAGKDFFNTEVMDSRPTNLYVAVIICALIGPIMLAAFLIYERGILAKQA